MTLPFNVAITSLATSMYAVVLPVALGANIFLIYITVVNKPYAKTTTNYLFANLAAFNLLNVIFKMPYDLWYVYALNAWFGSGFGQISCRLLHLADGVSIAGSILSLIAISLDQFYAILYPMKRLTVIQNKRLITCGMWTSSFVVMSPYLAMFGVKETTYHYNCIYLVRKGILMEIHFSFMFVFFYALPLAWIAVMYILIGRKLWFRTVTGNIHSIHRKVAELSKRRVVRMLIVVIATYALCWLPVHVFQMCKAFEQQMTDHVASQPWSIMASIAHANSAINPCLLIALNKNFRKEFFKIWTRWRTTSLHRCRQTFLQERGHQGNATIRGLGRIKSAEMILDEIARKRGTLYDLRRENNISKSSPVSLVRFTYTNKALLIKS